MSNWRNHFKDGTLITLKQGRTVFQRDDAIKSVYLVTSGTVSMQRILPNGDTLTLNHASTDDLLAEASLFTSNYHCDAITLEPTQLLSLRKSVLLKRLETTPQSLLSLTADTAREVQRLRSQIEILRLKRVAERLDAWLATNPAPDPGNWINVAAAIGVSPPALYRELAKRRQLS
ncbi:MAG: Crp/Fnr family transcriptional regulator [Paracoccaceae bacterium]